MGRLIEANELYKLIEENSYMLVDAFNSKDKGMFLIGIKEAIDKTPTAYDPDKVVEQLEQLRDIERLTGRGYCPEIDEEDSDRSCLTSELGCGYCAFEKAIEIVKGGAV